MTDETLWDLHPHTAAKHEIVRRYLGGWYPIMSSRNKRIVYIDGFAGPGEYKGGENGSPIIALETAIDHHYQDGLADEIVFLFIEKRRDRFEHLQRLLSQYELPDRIKVQTYPGRFSGRMEEILDYIEEQNARLAPTFALIDPFGFSGTPMSLISRVMGHSHCEVLITFAYESVNRFVSHSNEKIQQHLDDLFGTPDWRRAQSLRNPDERRQFLHDLYSSQLKEQAEVQYVWSFEMLDDGNRTEYFLFFGTNNYVGLKKMKSVMWAVDPGEGMQFSDYAASGEPILFGPEPDFDLLRDQLLQWGLGTDRSVDEIERFVVVETAFAHTHFKRQVLAKLEKGKELEVVSSPRKKRFSFPDRTIVRFPE